MAEGRFLYVNQWEQQFMFLFHLKSKKTQSFRILSFALTHSSLLSPRQTATTVRRLSDGSDCQTSDRKRVPLIRSIPYYSCKMFRFAQPQAAGLQTYERSAFIPTRKWLCHFCRQQTTFADFILSLQNGKRAAGFSFVELLHSPYNKSPNYRKYIRIFPHLIVPCFISGQVRSDKSLCGSVFVLFPILNSRHSHLSFTCCLAIFDD